MRKLVLFALLPLAALLAACDVVQAVPEEVRIAACAVGPVVIPERATDIAMLCQLAAAGVVLADGTITDEGLFLAYMR